MVAVWSSGVGFRSQKETRLEGKQGSEQAGPLKPHYGVRFFILKATESH